MNNHEFVNDHLDARLNEITTKSSALLSHVTLMIAVLTALFAVAVFSKHSEWVEYAFLLETLGYVVAAMLCIRSVGLVWPPNIKGNFDEYVLRKLAILHDRSRSYRYGFRFTICLTLLFFMTALADVSWRFYQRWAVT